MRTVTRWRLGAVATVVVAAALFALMSAGIAGANYVDPAPPYVAPSDCEHCHDTSTAHTQALVAPKKDFTVGNLTLPSDPTTAGVTYAGCKRCHRPSFTGGAHPHNAPGMPCSGCHPGWSNALPSAVAWYYETGIGASFNNADSSDLGKTDPAALHLIHSQTRWPAGVSTNDSRCSSCHAVAACTACHDEGAIDNVTHENHALTEPGMTTWSAEPWTRGFEPIETNYSLIKETTLTATEARCGSVKCHNIGSLVTTQAPVFQDNEYHGSGTTADSVFVTSTAAYTPDKVNNWRWWRGTAFSRASSRLSNVTSATVTFTFTGSRVVLIGDKDPYRGKMQVRIDGVSRGGDIDLYQETSAQQVEVFDSSKKGFVLTNAPHTIVISVAGVKNISARDYYVLVDQIRVYKAGIQQPEVSCTACHRHSTVSNNSLRHDGGAGGINITHVATTTAMAQTYSGYPCGDCHSAKIYDRGDAPIGQSSDHELTSSVNYLNGCTLCHDVITVKNDSLTDGYNYTCSYRSGRTNNGCHVAPAAGLEFGTVAHSNVTTAHAWTAVTDPAAAHCYDCHPGSLSVIHNNSIPTGAVTTCKTCHGFQVVPAGKTSCLDSGCHAGKTLTAHPYNTTPHTALISADTTTTGGATILTKLCTACHSAAMSAEHTSTASLGNITCLRCHENVSLGSKTVIANNWPAPKKCINCHSGITTHNQLRGAANDHDYSLKGGTCAGCHTSGPGHVINFSNVATIHADMTSTVAAGEGPSRSSCNLCHIDADTGITGTAGSRVPGLNSLSTVTNCDSCHLYDDIHTGTMFDHLATSASSDYVDGDAPTGCTNSGAGCHGSGSYNLQVVHGVSCGSNKYNVRNCHSTTGAGIAGSEFKSLDYTKLDNNNECTECHGAEDNGYRVDTPDRFALNDKWVAMPGDSGHYNETTHTAPSMTATIGAGGLSSATCTNCHNPGTTGAGLGLRNQHQNIRVRAITNPDGKLSCGNCHNYPGTAAVSVVVTTSAFVSCSSCHTAGVLGVVDPTLSYHGSAPVVAGFSTSNAGCTASGTNCHGTDSNLHSLHRGDNAIGDLNPSCSGGVGVRACHNYATQGIKPTTKDCDVCHVSYGTDNGAHYNAPKHQSTAPSATVAYMGTNCTACHPNISGNTIDLQPSHETTYATLSKPEGNIKAAIQVCLDCHNNSGSTTAVANDWSTKYCSACHGVGTIATAHGSVNTSHSAASSGCSSSGAGCHGSSDSLLTSGTPTAANNVVHTTCLRCHDKAASSATWNSATGIVNLQYNPTAKTCGNTGGACHNVGYNNTTLIHGGKQLPAADGNDPAHHLASAMSTAMVSGVASATCANCHSAALTTAHANSLTGWGTGGAVCTACHNSALPGTTYVSANQVKADWTSNDCADCHVDGASATRIPNRHSLYGTASHDGTSSVAQSCGASGAGCHTTYNLATLHGVTRADGCRVTGCHAADKAMTGASKSCGSGGPGTPCHGTYTGTVHGGTVTGNETSHTAASMTTVVDATYSAGGANTCDVCHSSGLANAHKETSTTARLDSANTTWAATTQSMCLDCHNATSPDGSVLTIKTDRWTPQTCDQCHVARGNGKHATYATNHVGSAAAGCTWSSSCHSNTLDLRALHNNSVTSNGSIAGCDSADCHDSRDEDMNFPATNNKKSCGTGGACHTGVTHTNHGSAEHNIDVLWAAAGSTMATFNAGGINYGPSLSIGCGGASGFGGALAWGCHYSDLVKEHSTVASGGAGRTMENGGSGCNVCHTGKGGSQGNDAAQSVIASAIAPQNDLRCETCHNGVEANGTAAGHQSAAAVTAGSTQIGVVRVGGGEFRSWKTNNVEYSGGHRAFADNPSWPLGAITGPIQGTGGTNWSITPGTMLMPLPFDATNYTTNPRAARPWAAGDIVLCEDCHWYNAPIAGPQGASVPLYVDGLATRPAAGQHWYNSINSGTTTPAPCNKCHRTVNQVTHRSGHSIPCEACHIRIPHAWKRPRLLRRNIARAAGETSGSIDPLPYSQASITGLQGYSIVSGQTNFQDGAMCQDNCNYVKGTAYTPGAPTTADGGQKHSEPAPYWP